MRQKPDMFFDSNTLFDEIDIYQFLCYKKIKLLSSPQKITDEFLNTLSQEVKRI